ncbi:MAG: alanine racemase, partial [Oscillospiraceae bacterium]
QHALALNEAARLAGGRLKVQIKLDTGMTRTGFDCVTEPQLDEAAAAYALDHLEVTGTFSHFSSSDDGREGADDYTRMQLARFLSALDGLTARGAAVGARHICNSGGAQKYPQARLDLVRCGAVLSGYNTAVGLEPWPLEPIADWKASVSCVREIGPGTPISYGRTFVAPHVMRVATLSIGYADGYPRALSNKGRVLLHGRWANLLGSVCMDQMMVDVTAIDGVQEGDVATILGRDGLLVQTADDLAA